MLYPPLAFLHRRQVVLPSGFQDAEFYQPDIGAYLYTIEDLEEEEFGWLGWNLPDRETSPACVPLEDVFNYVGPTFCHEVSERTKRWLAWADGDVSAHQNPAGIKELAADYRQILARHC